LDEIAELDVEVEGARLPVAEELILEGAPDDASGGGAVDHHLSEVRGYRAGDPGLDDAIHARPVRELGRQEIGKDVGVQQVLADDEEDLIAPAGVVAGVQIEDDVDEAPNVLHADGLSVRVNVLMATPRRRLGDKGLPYFGPPRRFSQPRRLGGGDSPQLALTP